MEHPQQEEEEDQGPCLTVAYIKKHLRENDKTYYSTPELNEVLYFQCKGFRKLENLTLFPDLKCLYFQSNGISKIEGLESLTKMKCLYLHENCISKIEGLSSLVNLRVLNLADNRISVIEGLKGLTQLDSLNVSKNVIGKAGLSDLTGLLDVPTLTAVDLSKNYIADPKVVDEVLAKLPNLALLYLMGNDAPKEIQNYRKRMISMLPKLKYLDDRPVFEDDRRCAEAFVRGGLEAERKEREKIKQEKLDKDEDNRKAFDELLRKAREEAKVEEKKEVDPALLRELAHDELESTISTEAGHDHEEVKKEAQIFPTQPEEEEHKLPPPPAKVEDQKETEETKEVPSSPETPKIEEIEKPSPETRREDLSPSPEKESQIASTVLPAVTPSEEAKVAAVPQETKKEVEAKVEATVPAPAGKQEEKDEVPSLEPIPQGEVTHN
ncbi:MAG: leucine-rich repeat protein [Candidatus Pacebacteria bacterium]|nr:leucine-rich repeat protein [Candidatus Paceibacterota bacterium]